MTRKADAIADLVLSTFRSLPKRFKPRSAERREWVPIAGVVLSKDVNHHDSASPGLECVALATGMKCHPHSKLPQLRGSGLHDSHAEILAIRAFNRFLLDECADLAAGSLTGKGSKWLKWRQESERLSGHDAASSFPPQQQQPFSLHEDVSIHMYCSEAPCGDASMELTMAKQEDPTPWASSSLSRPIGGKATASDADLAPTTMQGRGHFDQLGAVRRKPSRPDAPPSLSKSCTDKLALKQCTGLLSSITAHFIWPESVYLSSLVLPESEYVPAACERAFGRTGRMAPLSEPAVQEQWKRAGFSFTPFQVHTTREEFEYSKRYITLQQGPDGLEPVPSNRSCVYTPRLNEVLINGVLEGRKWNELRGASALARRRMWASAAGIAATLDLAPLRALNSPCSYGELKGSETLKGREEVKSDVRRLALQGWLRNDGDEDWSLSEEDRVVGKALLG